MNRILNKINGERSLMIESTATAKNLYGNEVCNLEQWRDFCINVKEKLASVMLCVTAGASSELVYNAFLQEKIIPQVIVCPDQFQSLYGKRLNSDMISDSEKCVWCLVGARTDCRIDAMLEDIVNRQNGYKENIYLLSKIGCILPDTGLRHMICHCRQVMMVHPPRSQVYGITGFKHCILTDADHRDSLNVVSIRFIIIVQICLDPYIRLYPC